MLRALNLILSPEAQWQKAALKPPGFAGVFFLSLLPFIILPLVVDGWSLMKYGEVFRGLAARTVPLERVITHEAFYGAASLLGILMGARILQKVGPSFN